MHLHYPSLILVPDTSFSALESSVPSSKNRPLSTSLLVQCIQDEFIGVPMESVLRKYWNEEGGMCLVTFFWLQCSEIMVTGLQFVNQLSVDNDDRAATLLASSSKYMHHFMPHHPKYSLSLPSDIIHFRPYALYSSILKLNSIHVMLHTHCSFDTRRLRELC